MTSLDYRPERHQSSVDRPTDLAPSGELSLDPPLPLGLIAVGAINFVRIVTMLLALLI
jgi:hypothetical protein